jgi:glycosyltransferase involved in cell wall biosynthesis
MATYNGEAYLKNQLESIFIQLPENSEIIISDDGSSDNTLELIRSFNHPKIKLLINTGKKGIVPNFENALRASSGEVIFLCDQDDVWEPNKIEVCLNYLQTYELVVSDCKVINEENEILVNSYFSRRKSGPGLIKNLAANTYLGCCIAFTRKVLEIALPFPKNITMHDIWLGFVAEVFFTPFFIKQPLVLYRTHSNNVTPTSTGVSKYSLPQQFVFRWNIIKYFPNLIIRRLKNGSKHNYSLL